MAVKRTARRKKKPLTIQQAVKRAFAALAKKKRRA